MIAAVMRRIDQIARTATAAFLFVVIASGFARTALAQTAQPPAGIPGPPLRPAPDIAVPAITPPSDADKAAMPIRPAPPGTELPLKPLPPGASRTEGLPIKPMEAKPN